MSKYLVDLPWSFIWSMAQTIFASRVFLHHSDPERVVWTFEPHWNHPYLNIQHLGDFFGPVDKRMFLLVWERLDLKTGLWWSLLNWAKTFLSSRDWDTPLSWVLERFLPPGKPLDQRIKGCNQQVWTYFKERFWTGMICGSNICFQKLVALIPWNNWDEIIGIWWE